MISHGDRRNGYVDPEPDEAEETASPAETEIVCPRYELIYTYIQQVKRPLVNLEQRAFLYLLDLDADARYVHADGPDCVCMDILPHIVQALDPDPVDCIVAERTLENESYASQRWHTEKVGRFQGIVLGQKTAREHTNDLRKLVRAQLKDMETVLHEILRRPMPEYVSSQEMIEHEFPKFVELTKLLAGKRKRAAQDKTPGLTWANVREHLEANYLREVAVLQDLKRSLAEWGIH